MAGKEIQIEQAIEAVKRQPGSPAYAFLAEHYLEQGQEDEALRICQSGFAANPGFERGVVAYLSVLRRKHDVHAASEVYGRAIAYLPRSARVRVAWAFLLADSGKEREARIIAREALDLDPLNREARAFVATLGGTPSPRPIGRTPSSATSRLAALSKDAVFDSSDLAGEGEGPQAGGPGPRAEVRPWIRPIGQRTTPHKMFDLTPVPSPMDPQHRHILRHGDVAITPAPVSTTTAEEAPTEPAREGGEAQSASSSAKPSSPPAKPSSTSRSDVSRAAAALRPIPTPSRPFWTTPLPGKPTRPSSTPPPRLSTPTPISLRPVSKAPPPLPGQGIESSPPPFAETEEAPTEESAAFDDKTANGLVEAKEIPLAPSQPAHALDEIDRTEKSEEPVPVGIEPALRPPVRHLGRWILLGAAVVVLAAGAVVGFRFYRAAALKRSVNRSLEDIRSDLLATYLGARQDLARLQKNHADDPRVCAALAIIDVHLAVRFSAGEGAERRARDLLARVPSRDPPEMAVVAAALLDSAHGQGERALKQLNAALVERSWQARLAAARAAMAAGQRQRAEQLLDAGLKLKPPAPALLEEAAIFYRRAGMRLKGLDAVAQGLRASPGHPGLRIQQALLADLNLPNQVRPEELDALAGQMGRLRAAVALLEARRAKQHGDMTAAITHLEDAMRLDPSDPEAGTELAMWLLGSGGDAARADALLAKHVPAMSLFRPGVGLDRAQALLLLGRPQEAREHLSHISPDKLSVEERGRLAVLELRAAHWADEASLVESACQNVEGLPNKAAVCAEALLERGKLSRFTALLKAVSDPRATGYLNGIRALARGDTSRAITELGKATKWELDPGAPVLALARAQARQGNPAEAVKLLRGAVKLDAGSVRSRVTLALALVSMGHDTEAQTLLEGVLANRPTQPSVIAQTGEAFLAMGQAPKASALVEQGIKQDPGAVVIRLLAGRVAQANRQPEEAKRHFNEVLQRDPRNAEALVELGRLEEASGQSAQARRRFAAALKLRPKDPELLFLVARAQARSGDVHAAVSNGSRAIRLLKGTAQEARTYEMMMELGKLLAQRERWARKRAEEFFFEATKPKNAPAPPFIELGRLHRAQGDMKRAIWCFRQAVERDPNLADAYLELGRTLRVKPQWRKEAKASLRHYLKLRPDGKDAPKVRAMLEKMH